MTPKEKEKKLESEEILQGEGKKKTPLQEKCQNAKPFFFFFFFFSLNFSYCEVRREMLEMPENAENATARMKWKQEPQKKQPKKNPKSMNLVKLRPSTKRIVFFPPLLILSSHLYQ